jgi:hypothetical protein
MILIRLIPPYIRRQISRMEKSIMVEFSFINVDISEVDHHLLAWNADRHAPEYKYTINIE